MAKSKQFNQAQKDFFSRQPVRFVSTFALILIGYGFGSWAIDTGIWLHYFLAVFFAGWGINTFVRFVQGLRKEK